MTRSGSDAEGNRRQRAERHNRRQARLKKRPFGRPPQLTAASVPENRLAMRLHFDGHETDQKEHSICQGRFIKNYRHNKQVARWNPRNHHNMKSGPSVLSASFNALEMFDYHATRSRKDGWVIGSGRKRKEPTVPPAEPTLPRTLFVFRKRCSPVGRMMSATSSNHRLQPSGRSPLTSSPYCQKSDVAPAFS